MGCWELQTTSDVGGEKKEAKVNDQISVDIFPRKNVALEEPRILKIFQENDVTIGWYF